MAYNVRYYNEFESLHYKRLVRVEILERDYAGLSEQISMGASLHLSDSGDGREEPIKKLTASLRLNSTYNFQFQHLFTADDRKYQVKIIRNSVTVFIGFLESDSYSEPYWSWKNYTVRLTARDNLGRLEDIPYDPITGLIFRVDNVLGNVLLQTGLSLPVDDNINIHSSDMNASNPTLGQTYLNERKYLDEDNEQESGLYVLTDILGGFGSQIRQVNGQWVVEEQANYYSRPTVQGNSASFPSYLRDRLNFPEVTKAFKWINKDAEMVIQPAWKDFEITQDYRLTENVFLYFPKSIDDFTSTAGPRDASTINGWDMQDIDYVIPRSFGNKGFRLPSSIPLPVLGSLITEPLAMLQSTDDITFTFKVGVKGLGGVKRDIKVDIIVLTAPNTGYILKDTGWATYNGSQVEEIVFTDISSDSGITDLTVTASGIPVDGDLIIRLWPNTNTTNFQGFDYEDIVIKSGDEDRGTQSEQSLTAVIDENNNLSEDDIEFTIGQVPSNPNAELIHYGGLFDINGVAQEDWKRPGDTTAESLLKKVAIGYDLQNKQSSRQVTGTVIWDHDIWTNIDDQNKRLMINSINEWNMNTDEMTAEWVEVFEYKNTKGAFDLGFDDNFDNNTSDDYQTNTIFTITENYE